MLPCLEYIKKTSKTLTVVMLSFAVLWNVASWLAVEPDLLDSCETVSCVTGWQRSFVHTVDTVGKEALSTKWGKTNLLIYFRKNYKLFSIFMFKKKIVCTYKKLFFFAIKLDAKRGQSVSGWSRWNRTSQHVHVRSWYSIFFFKNKKS